MWTTENFESFCKEHKYDLYDAIQIIKLNMQQLGHLYDYYMVKLYNKLHTDKIVTFNHCITK